MSMDLMLPVLLVGGVVGVAVYVLFVRLDERQVVRETLRQLDGYELENQRDQELLAPLRERALGPILHGLTDLGRRFTPTGYVDKVRQKFVYTGDASAEAVDRFLAVRVVTAVLAVFAFFAFFVFKLVPLEGSSNLAVGALTMMVLLIGPDASLNRKVEARQTAIQRMLPDVLDLLTISVEAGLGFEQAIDRVIEAVPGPLTDEFARMLGEVRAGSSRADAMRAMDERCNVAELRSFVLAILQADTFGVSIGRVLRSQAEEMRIKRRQLAQEKAQKAPVKMLIPMVFCIFPALFVVVLGPAALNIAEKM
jgi:tight adherence protein C